MADEKLVPELDELEVPKYLEPDNLDAAQVEAMKLLPLPAADAKSLESAIKKLGLKKVTARQILDLQSLGVIFPPASMMRLATGDSVVTLMGMTQAFTEVMRIFHASNDKAKLKIISQIGFLGKALTTAQKEIQSNARKNLPRAVDPAGQVKAHRFPTLQVVIQNAAGETIVKPQEKAIDVEAVKQ